MNRLSHASQLSHQSTCQRVERSMSRLAWQAALLLILLLATSHAFADATLPGFPSSRLQAPSTGLSQYILGPACLSMAAGPLDLDCNPAFLANSQKTLIRVDVTANDKVVKLNDYREKLTGDDSVGVVNSLLGQQGPLMADATSEVWYQNHWWAIGWTPFRGGFTSLVTNPAYPHVAADMYKEDELFGKIGFAPADDKNLQVGVQARYVDRQSFHQQFDLLDVVSDPSALKIDNTKILFLEPGLNYSFDGSWNNAISATITQLAVYQSGDTDPFQPIFDVGFTTSPSFLKQYLNGNFRTTTHYTSNPEITDLFARIYQAAIYDFQDKLSVSVSLGKSVLGAGINGRIESLVLGVGWKTEDISTDAYQTQRVSTYLFELGLAF